MPKPRQTINTEETLNGLEEILKFGDAGRPFQFTDLREYLGYMPRVPQAARLHNLLKILAREGALTVLPGRERNRFFMIRDEEKIRSRIAELQQMNGAKSQSGVKSISARDLSSLHARLAGIEDSVAAILSKLDAILREIREDE